MKEEILNALLHLKSESLIIAQATGEIIHSSDSAETLLGYHASELAGMRIDQLVPDFNHTFELSQAYSEDTKSSQGMVSKNSFPEMIAYRKGQIPLVVKIGVIHFKLETDSYSLLILKEIHNDNTVSKNW